MLGAGSWGTALAVHLARLGLSVRLWARRPELAQQLEEEGRNALYLPETEFPEGLRATADLGQAAQHDLALVVVPLTAFARCCGRFSSGGPPGVP